MISIPKDLIEELKSKFIGLQTFEDVQEWDNSAENLLKSLRLIINNVQSSLATKQSEAIRLQNEHEEKSFFEKLTSGKKEIKVIEKDIKAIEEMLITLNNIIEEFQSKIDITPNSPEEQSLLLKELQTEKKELNTRKKELNAKMREIRTAARQKTVNSTDSLTGLIAGKKYRAAVRRDIRYSKEQILSPHEDEKTNIERHLLQIEKEINWVEKFKYKNLPQENPNTPLN